MKKIAVITGAGSGIGQATALRFLEAGWKVGLVGRRKDALEETAGGNADAAAFPCDVSDEGQVAATFKAITDHFGRIDVLFNNAGGGSPAATIDDVSVEDWHRVIATNVTGSFLCAQAAFRQMRAQAPQGGRIINNGSVSATAPRWGSSPYSTSKHAITGLTKSVALDGRGFSIACGQIDVGNALTDLARRMTKGVPQANGEIMVEPVMDVGHVGQAVLNMAELPLDVNILYQTIMATEMPFVGRG